MLKRTFANLRFAHGLRHSVPLAFRTPFCRAHALSPFGPLGFREYYTFSHGLVAAYKAFQEQNGHKTYTKQKQENQVVHRTHTEKHQTAA